MPHARHAGKAILEEALAGSKLDGTEFEKEQIGQTQVPLFCPFGLVKLEVVRCGRASSGDWIGVRSGDCVDETFGPVVLGLGCNCDDLAGFENKVTLGEDLKKPACNLSDGQGVWASSCAHIVFIVVNLFQLNSDGVLSGIRVVNKANPVTGEIDVAVL